MIEHASEFGASTSAAPLVAQDVTHLTAGEMLRQAREAHGLHIDMVAAALKVSSRKLAALEADDIDALPDAVFARALAASVCRALRVDPAPVLAKLPGARSSGLAQADRTISKTVRSAAPRSNGDAGGLPSKALMAVVALLLVGAAGLFWLPQSAFDRLGASFPRFASSGASDDGAAPSEAGGSAVAGGAVVEAVTPSVAVATAPPAVVAPPPVAAAPVADDALVVVARADSWVTVTEAGGKPLLRRTVQAGETVKLNGTLPLSVVVGRAAGVDVQVRGKPFDLASISRGGGVARFEVKP